VKHRIEYRLDHELDHPDEPEDHATASQQDAGYVEHTGELRKNDLRRTVGKTSRQTFATVLVRIKDETPR